jgi:hypothetical protein
VTEDQIGLWPIPTSANTLTIVYEVRRKTLNLEDYTTGSINSIDNCSTTVTGNGTVWTTKMNGMWICITNSEADNTGDGVWYEISTVNSTTELTLKKPYGGQAISSGTAAYTIGQTSLIPEDYQSIPVYRAAQVYFTAYNPNAERAGMFKNLYVEKLGIMENNFTTKNTNPVVSDELQYQMDNPNNFIRL